MKKLTLLVGLLVLASGCAATQPAALKTAVAPADNTAKPNFTVIELANASAVEMRDLLANLLYASEKQRTQDFVATPPGTAPQHVAPRPMATIAADPRTNSLIVSWFDDADLQTVRDLIARLDVKL